MKANLFDAAYYRAVNPDLVAAGLKTDRQLFAHFKNFGIYQGRAFSTFVDLKYYRESNPDLIAAGLKTNFQLYEHLQKTGLAEGRRFSPWLDLDFYLAANPDLERAFRGDRIQAFEHLQQFGLAEGRQFSPWVDVDFYLAANPDLNTRLKGDRAKAFEHLQRFGLGEGRRFSPVVDLDFYLGDNPDLLQAFGSDRQRSFEHLQTYGIDEGRRLSATFQPNYYRGVNPDLAALNFNNRQLLQHYTIYGLDEGRSASEFFNARYYLKTYPDLVQAGLNYRQAVQHFTLFGLSEKRSPFAGFSEAGYLEFNPDVKQAVEQGRISSGFEHYVKFGGSERRVLRIFRNPNPQGFDVVDRSLMPRPGYDRFGTSVATIGNNLLVGVPGEDTNGLNRLNNAGVAYLFDGTTGTLLRTFQNPNPEQALFGSQVAAVGNNVLIGTTNALYLFDSNGGNLLWSFQFNRFINSVAVVGNNILIGAPYEDVGARNVGAAYLFDGSNGNLLRTFQNPTPEEFDQFGYSVAAVGNNILMGAPRDNTNAPSAGAAYLFDSVTGNLLRTFHSPNPDPGTFGFSAVAVGDRVLIGAPGEDRGAISSGAAYLFDSVTGNLVQTFPNPTPEQGEFFGAKVAAVGNNVLIGAPYDNGGGNSPVGAVYLFDSTTGSLLKTFQPSNPQSFVFNYRAYDFFGSSLAALDNHAVIGVSAEMVGGFTSAGAVYLF